MIDYPHLRICKSNPEKRTTKYFVQTQSTIIFNLKSKNIDKNAKTESK